jgi:hypothetical protein
MVPAVQGIFHMDSQDLAGPIFHPHVATSSIFRYNWCCRGGGQAHTVIGATACTDIPRQSSPIQTFQQISPILYLTNLCTYERGCPCPSKSSQAYCCSSSNHES